MLCDDPVQEDVTVPEIPGCRGGLQMRLGTLNIGALSGKEDILRGLECDVCALQRNGCPRHKRASISAYIRQLGGYCLF